MTELLSIPLAKDQIGKLWKRLANLRASRQDELEEIRNVFGDPDLLAECYIEPDCQRTSPADHNEDEPTRTFRQPVSGWLNPFFEGEFFERDGRNTLFVLSDAGMGKSSLLMMLKLSHLMEFWPSGLNVRLLKLGEDTLDIVSSLKKRNKTILLLDALDEDPLAWGRVEPRLKDLLDLGKSFRQVIITCRTQFFPKGGNTPVESPEKIEIAGYICNLIYLSPFNREQVETYLSKRFPNTTLDRVRKFFTEADNQTLVKARQLVEPMRSLRIRPMLLAYIDVLLDADIEDHNEYSIYRALIACWLAREQRKPEGGLDKETLWEACMLVALHLQQTGTRNLTKTALDKLIREHAIARQIRTIDVRGRSLLNVDSDGNYRFAHYSIQEFLVAHWLITEGKNELDSPLRTTDQLLSFLFAWGRQNPQNAEQIPWALLDIGPTTKNGVEFVLVPGGEFTLGEGSTEHRVRLSPYFISKNPITNGQYAPFLEANPEVEKPIYWDHEDFNDPDQPVVGVSWIDAMAYCRWTGFNLPTEVQWEAAARGPEARRYPWGDDAPTPQLANYGESDFKRTSPVGSYPLGAGPYGTLDQAGNVWEWCRDEYEGDAYKNCAGTVDPWMPAENENDPIAFRVIRSGCWASPAQYLVSASRDGYRAGRRRQVLGFRVCSVFGPEDG